MPNNPVLPLGSQPDTDNFQVYTQRPVVRFLKQGVQPPSQVYVTASDNIQVGCASSQVNEAVTITYRLLRADGELIEGQFIVHPPADRSIKVYSEDLAEGFLLSVSCKAAVATTRGQTFVRVFLTHPELGAGQPSYMLMADYVTTAMAPAHPNGRVLAPSEGPGNRRQILTSVTRPWFNVACNCACKCTVDCTRVRGIAYHGRGCRQSLYIYGSVCFRADSVCWRR